VFWALVSIKCCCVKIQLGNFPVRYFFLCFSMGTSLVNKTLEDAWMVCYYEGYKVTLFEILRNVLYCHNILHVKANSVRVLEISGKAHENNLRWTIFATNFLYTINGSKDWLPPRLELQNSWKKHQSYTYYHPCGWHPPKSSDLLELELYRII